MHEDFRALFDGHAARVVRLAALLGAEDPEGVAQETFCCLYEKRDDLHGPMAQAGPYLNRIVVNLVRDRHRRTTTQHRLSLVVLHEQGGSEVIDGVDASELLNRALDRLG